LNQTIAWARFKYLLKVLFGEWEALKKQYVYVLVALVTLICYYFALSLIQVPQEIQLTFVLLTFVGYFVLGFVFGFLFRRDALANFVLVFAIGFLGALLSIISHIALLDPESLYKALQDLANLLVASFFIGVTAAAGTLVNAVIVWVRRRRARKRNKQRDSQTTEQPSQDAEVVC